MQMLEAKGLAEFVHLPDITFKEFEKVVTWTRPAGASK
jgi:hypothetical protein